MPRGIYKRFRRGAYKVPRHEITQPSNQSCKLIPLTHGYNAIIDTEDFRRVSKWNWQVHQHHKSQTTYARGKINGRLVLMHQYILFEKFERIDHRDGNGLNNRKKNLRNCTNSQNVQNGKLRKCNKSGFAGVHKNGKKWRAFVGKNYKIYYLGLFDTPEEAAIARDKKAKQLHGKFAKLNF